MEKFTLINKDRSWIKICGPFEDISKPSPSIDAMMISYGCVYKSSKPVMKSSRVETIEAARKEYAELLKKVGRKPLFYKLFLIFRPLHLHNFLPLLILVDLDKFKCKIKELKR